jgi:hypothetical protein
MLTFPFWTTMTSSATKKSSTGLIEEGKRGSLVTLRKQDLSTIVNLLRHLYSLSIG